MITSRKLITVSTAEACHSLLRTKDVHVANMSHLLDEIAHVTGCTLPYLRRYACTSLFNLNGEDHLRLKQILAAYYSNTRLQAWIPDISRITCESLEALSSDTEVDLLADYINRVTAHISYFSLGLNARDHLQFQPLVSSLLRLTNFQHPLKIRDLVQLDQDAESLYNLIRQNIEDTGPDGTETDCDNNFFHYQMQRHRLTETQIITHMMTLLAAGISTQHTLANMLVELLKCSPVERHDFLTSQSPAQVIERLLYTAGGVKTLYRFIDQPSQMLPEGAESGDMIAIEIATANRLALASACPFSTEFTPPRKFNFAFGKGVHKCIGESLSRIALEHCLLGFIQRFPNTTLNSPQPDYFYTASPHSSLWVTLHD